MIKLFISDSTKKKPLLIFKEGRKVTKDKNLTSLILNRHKLKKQ